MMHDEARDHVGATVIYAPMYGKAEVGTIKSVNDTWVHVDYDGQVKATAASHLFFPRGLYDYEVSREIALRDEPFYALIMAAAREADTDNLRLLRKVFPETVAELEVRYHAPGGLLPGEVVNS